MNILKEKIKKGEKTFGAQLCMGETYVADIYGMLGYDFVWLDTEHSGIDYGKLLNCITVLRAYKTPVVVRVQMDNYNHTKKVLEMGVDGIIFPMVDTPEYADTCMKSTLYPPLGNRGSGPLGAIGYGMKTNMQYIAEQEENLCRFIQIESETAVKNLPEIVKNPYIDGYIFGPFDMSGSIGRLGDVYCEKNISLVKEAVKILKANGKYIGMAMNSTDEAEQRRWLELGADMITSGADWDYIFRESKKTLEQLRAIAKDYQ